MKHYISTHALTEGDKRDPVARTNAQHFNSRPHGGRPDRFVPFVFSSVFQLTPSRRATATLEFEDMDLAFQLTPSRRATPLMKLSAYHKDFNSRPHGGRRQI